jgi:hypothetical protein
MSPILEAHKIPWLSESIESSLDGTSQYSFPVTSATAMWGTVMGTYFAQQGCQTGSAMYVNATTVQGVFNQIQQSLAKAGTKGIPSSLKFHVSASEASFLPEVTQIADSSAQCLYGLLTPNQVSLVENAIISSKKPSLPMLTYCQSVTSDVAKVMGAHGNGYVACGARLPSETGLPILARIQSLSGSNYVQADILNWAMADILTAALKQVSGKVTAESTHAALSDLTNVGTDGILPPYTTSIPPKPVLGYTRVFNPTVNLWKFNSQGTPVLETSINGAA